MSIEDNRVVLKQFFFLHVAPFLKFRVPKNSEVLKVKMSEDNKTVMLWYLCDPNEEQEERILAIIRDGQIIDSEWHRYLDTLYFNDSAYHIFERYTG